jgi:hypothetical protein
MNIHTFTTPPSSEWSARNHPGPRTFHEPRSVKVQHSGDSSRSVAKRRQLMVSFVVSAIITLVAFFLGLIELVGLWRFAHPLFWFPLAVGAFGVAGSTRIYLRRLSVQRGAEVEIIVFTAGQNPSVEPPGPFASSTRT